MPMTTCGTRYHADMKIRPLQPSKGLAVISPPMEILYNDCNASRKTDLDKYMNPHAYSAFETRPTAPAWADAGFDGRRVYVRTLNDCCNPASLQDKWIKTSNVKWDVIDMHAGHMPFESQPEVLAKHVVRSVDSFSTISLQNEWPPRDWQIEGWNFTAALWRISAPVRSYIGGFLKS